MAEKTTSTTFSDKEVKSKAVIDNDRVDLDPCLLGQLEKACCLRDSRKVKAARAYFKIAAAEDLPRLLKSLSDIAVNHEKVKPAVRMQAALQLKDAFDSNQWLQFPDEVRDHIKKNVLDSLGTELCRPSSIAQCVASIACKELPYNMWLDLIPRLISNVFNPDSKEALKESTFEAIGYIRRKINPEILKPQSYEILTAIVDAITKDPSIHVRQAATKALRYFLKLSKARSNQMMGGHDIMQDVCYEAAQSTDTMVRDAAIHCLVKLMDSALFTKMVDAIKEDDVIALQGIKTISTLVKTINREANSTELASLREYLFHDTRRFKKLILNLLLWIENEDAQQCLMLMVSCQGLLAIAIALANLKSDEWIYRFTAVKVFDLFVFVGGPMGEAMKPVLYKVMPWLFACKNDLHSAVEYIANSTLEKIFEIHPRFFFCGENANAILSRFILNRLHGSSPYTIGPELNENRDMIMYALQRIQSYEKFQKLIFIDYYS